MLTKLSSVASSSKQEFRWEDFGLIFPTNPFPFTLHHFLFTFFRQKIILHDFKKLVSCRMAHDSGNLRLGKALVLLWFNKVGYRPRP